MSGEVIEAAVQVGGDVTPYLRCGRGPHARLVLAVDPAERLRLLCAAAVGCVAVAPLIDPAADASVLIGRLRGLLEGLGMETPEVVAAAELEEVADALREG